MTKGERIPPVVRRLGWISFCLDVAAEMVYPLVPLFLASVLRAPGIALGLIEGTADGLLAIFTALAGRRSDRIRRRVPFIRAGYGIAALAKPLLSLAYAWPVVLALRALDRLGKGVRTAPRDALIADAVEAKQRGAAFGFHRAMDTAGALTGVLFAIALLHFLPGEYRTIFALTAIPGVIAVALTFLLREPASHAAETSEPPVKAPLGANFWRTAIVLWTFAIANSSDSFLLLRAKNAGFTDSEVVWHYALMNLLYASSAFPAGKLSDRLGRARVIGIGWAIYAAVYAGFAWLDASWLWIAFAVYGIYLGLTQGVASAWIADHAPRGLRATALGTYQFGLGIALISSSAIAGWLWDSVGPTSPFVFGSAVAAIALVALPLVARPQPA